jgi:hypothetical protein
MNGVLKTRESSRKTRNNNAGLKTATALGYTGVDKKLPCPETQRVRGQGVGFLLDLDYFRLFTYSATALASSAATPDTAFLCGAFLASSPLVSRSVI